MNLKKQIKEIYEDEAKTYDKTREIFEKGRFANRERKLLSEFLKRKSLVLNLACGTGRHLEFFVNRLENEVVGIDISVNMLKIGKTKLLNTVKKNKNVHLIVADAENLPFRENIFDAVVCSRAFYLFDNKFRILQEAHRVLKKRGNLAISSIFMDLLLTRIGIKMGLLGADPKQYPYTSKQLVDMFRKAEFENIYRKCIVLFTGELTFLPKPFLHIINVIEDKLQGGRWVMVLGKKKQRI